MSSALPYLRSLRKADLQQLAETTGLKGYKDLLKGDLESTLDDHLSENRASLAQSTDDKLIEYFRRLGLPSRASPVKKEPKGESATPGRPVRARRQVKPKEEIDATTDESDASSVSKSSPPPPARTPGRPSLSFPSLPPSPAVVTDAIDRQTTRVRRAASNVWDSSGLTERSHALRSCLSSVGAIKSVILSIELIGLAREIVPMRYLTTFPALPSAGTPSMAVKIPDLFVLVSSSFWAPFSLWLMTSVLIPSVFAYFFNISLKINAPAHSYGTRRSSGAAGAKGGRAKWELDPLVYNIAKALVSYLVYANGYTFCDVYSRYTVGLVPLAVPGGLAGLLTGSAIGAVGSLYEAILRK